MTSSQSKVQTITARFQADDNRALISVAQNAKFSFVVLANKHFVPGKRVQVDFFCKAPSPASPVDNLQPIGAQVTAVVQADSTASVVLVFGDQGKLETPCVSFCGISLPQQAAPPKGEPLSLELVCTVRSCAGTSEDRRVADDHDEATDWLGQIHLLLSSSWSHSVFTHAMHLFSSSARAELPDFLPIALVDRLMRHRWAAASVFGLAAAQEKAKEMEGRADVQFPALTRKNINEILRLVLSHTQWVAGEFPPLLVSKYVFCGGGNATVDKIASLWSVFETLIELVGRSLFVRELFASGQLFFFTPDDVVELSIEAMSSLKGVGDQPPLIHLFRISRSLSSTPALVLEMMEIVDGTARKVQPSPYVTLDQIIAAGGDVYKAFANLTSIHHAKLSTLNPAHRIRPSSEMPVPSSTAGRRVRCEVVGARDALNAKLRDGNDMSARLWWSSPTKLRLSSFQAMQEGLARARLIDRAVTEMTAKRGAPNRPANKSEPSRKRSAQMSPRRLLATPDRVSETNSPCRCRTATPGRHDLSEETDSLTQSC